MTLSLFMKGSGGVFLLGRSTTPMPHDAAADADDASAAAGEEGEGEGEARAAPEDSSAFTCERMRQCGCSSGLPRGVCCCDACMRARERRRWRHLVLLRKVLMLHMR